MQVKEAGRGLMCVEFEDRNANRCSLQESSIATEACIWLGVMQQGPQFEQIPSPVRMHLTVDQVRDLIPHLQHFVEYGILGDVQEKSEEAAEHDKLARIISELNEKVTARKEFLEPVISRELFGGHLVPTPVRVEMMALQSALVGVFAEELNEIWERI